jgi:hypothetical protein
MLGTSWVPAACWSLLFRALSDNRALSDLNERFLGALNDKAGVFDFFDPSDNTAISHDFVVDLELRDHFGELVSLTSLRSDHQEIKDTEDQGEHNKGAVKSARTCILKK